MTPSNYRFVSGGERGRLMEFARRRGERSFTLGEACREADIPATRELMVIAEGLVREGSLRKCGPIQFKYAQPAPAPEDAPAAQLRVSLPRTEVEKEATPSARPADEGALPRSPPAAGPEDSAGFASTPPPRGAEEGGISRTCECGAAFTPSSPRQTYCSPRCQKRNEVRRARARELAKEATPVVVAPPSGPTPPSPAPPQRRELLATAASRPRPPPAPSIGEQIRALPVDGRPGRQPRTKEKPMPTSPLERLLEIRKRKAALQDELDGLVNEEADLVAAIRTVLGEDGAPVQAGRPRHKKARAAPVRKVHGGGRGHVGDLHPDSNSSRVLALLQAKKVPVGIGETAKALKLDVDVTRVTLGKLSRMGHLKRVSRGKYEAA